MTKLENIDKCAYVLNQLMFNRGHRSMIGEQIFYFANSDKHRCFGFSYNKIIFKKDNYEIKKKLKEDDYRNKMDGYLLELIKDELITYDIDKIRMYYKTTDKYANDYNEYSWNKELNEYVLTETMKNNIVIKHVMMKVKPLITLNTINVNIP